MSTYSVPDSNTACVSSIQYMEKEGSQTFCCLPLSWDSQISTGEVIENSSGHSTKEAVIIRNNANSVNPHELCKPHSLAHSSRFCKFYVLSVHFSTKKCIIPHMHNQIF